MKDTWISKSNDPLTGEGGAVHPILAQILANRFIDSKEFEQFLRPDYTRDIHDPYLFDDMTKAVERIKHAIDTKEKITIYGDYDVDGVCASTILYEILSDLGANVNIVINHREREGYGLQQKALERLKEEGTTLIITDDSGITNTNEIAYAQKSGMDVILTDHHQPPALDRIPPAFAIIHPLVHGDRYPFKHLAGAGVAFKVVQGLLRTEWVQEKFLQKKLSLEGYEKWMLDIVSIATIADCMPITGENRALVHFGLIVLNKTRRHGLRALYQSARLIGKKITSHTIGFCIAPRLNAASRMEHGKLAFDLLTTKNIDAAISLADQLEETNTRRQKLTEVTVKKARETLHEQFEAGKKILVGIGSDWPLGILGLVASRLMNEFSRPIVLVTESEAGRIGAARSMEPFHITNVFKQIDHLFARFGGHAAAGGFALHEHIDTASIAQSFHEVAKDMPVSETTTKAHMYDTELQLADITWEFLELLDFLEPHGIGNKKPLFVLRNLTVLEVSYVGAKNQHVRMTLSDGKIKRKSIGFSLAKENFTVKAGDSVDIITEVEIHEWRDIREPQLSLVDVDLPVRELNAATETQEIHSKIETVEVSL